MTKPRYLIQINFNEEDIKKLEKIEKVILLPRARIVRLALFEPERYQELLTRSQSVNRKGE